MNPELNVGASGTVILNNIATIDVTDIGTHTLRIYTYSDIDVKNSNDTLEYTFETYQLPDVNLAIDKFQTYTLGYHLKLINCLM